MYSDDHLSYILIITYHPYSRPAILVVECSLCTTFTRTLEMLHSQISLIEQHCEANCTMALLRIIISQIILFARNMCESLLQQQRTSTQQSTFKASKNWKWNISKRPHFYFSIICQPRSNLTVLTVINSLGRRNGNMKNTSFTTVLILLTF